MRKCNVKYITAEVRDQLTKAVVTPRTEGTRPAIFHAWGMNADEAAAICWSMGIVEYEDGSVQLAHPDDIVFESPYQKPVEIQFDPVGTAGLKDVDILLNGKKLNIPASGVVEVSVTAEEAKQIHEAFMKQTGISDVYQIPHKAAAQDSDSMMAFEAALISIAQCRMEPRRFMQGEVITKGDGAYFLVTYVYSDSIQVREYDPEHPDIHHSNRHTIYPPYYYLYKTYNTTKG